MDDVVIMTGPCGVGKSSVAFECMNLLEEGGGSCAMVDAELAYFHPKAPDDPFGYAVAEEALRALVGVYEAQGLTRLLLGRVVENAEQLAIVERAVSGARIRVFRLVADRAIVMERLAKREIGSALAWHVQRSDEIAASNLGEPVDAERPVGEIAADVLRRAGWLGGA